MNNTDDLRRTFMSLETHTKDFVSANILQIEVGTTGHCGGDSGHGARTYFRLTDLSSTDIDISVSDDRKSVEIVLGGDTEIDTFLGSLKYAVEVLQTQAFLREV